jgi:ribose 5-phosphate isomerase A
MQALAERLRSGQHHIYGVGTSAATEHFAMQQDIPLLSLEQAGVLDVTIDGADEVDADLNLIKGYGRALVREKVVAAASRQLIILVGEEKLVSRLGSRGKLPVEVIPFAVPLCERRLRDLGCEPTLYRRNGEPFKSDNGNYILDCRVEPIANPAALESQIRSIPGVVDTGLFLGLADIVLVGNPNDFGLIAEKRRERTRTEASCRVPESVQEQAPLNHSKRATAEGDIAHPARSQYSLSNH